jgi:hypothetical protein
VAACYRAPEALQLDRHLGGLDHDRDAVDDRRAVDVGSGVGAEQHHRNASGWHDDVSAAVDQAPGLALE